MSSSMSIVLEAVIRAVKPRGGRSKLEAPSLQGSCNLSKSVVKDRENRHYP